MPHTKSAKKHVRKSAKRRLHNRAVVKSIKKQLRAFNEALDSGNLDQAKKEFNLTAKKLDKAAARRVIHPNLAARKKSQLALKLNRKQAGPTKAAT
jgi:small subunit ribosomal protein S20